MSLQFGRWNFDGKPVEQDYLGKIQPLLLAYGPDDRASYSNASMGMLYFAFHTTRESRREKQPHAMASGAIITWDGRLDNRVDLSRQLGDVVTSESTDLSIVAAAYERWGISCFAQLIGDWALSIWDPRTRSLILAKDPIGVRHLYYSLDDSQVTWSTVLDPLVLLAGKTFTICEEYIAGLFSLFPAAHLTPYSGIHAVPPSCSVLIQAGKHEIRAYWNFESSKEIRYRTDVQYQEHFRAVFGQAVRRRLRSDAPVLAELSGGMDSSSIVCMADDIVAGGEADTPRLDTVSYYDDSEPNWNERPYFTKVEEKRGRVGTHIDLCSVQNIEPEGDTDCLMIMPASSTGRTNEASRQFAACLRSQGNRVLLSGVGGDEVMGGVPTPIPELQNLLARMHLRKLPHQLKLWALNQRKPWFHILFQAAGGFFTPNFFGTQTDKRFFDWLTSQFFERNRAALRGYESRTKLLGPLPTFQGNMGTLDVLRRQLASSALPTNPVMEKRYSFLDRDLLEFIYAIPREQLVRPGCRRYLMRQALAGIVPNAILDRKRKAFVSRRPLVTISDQWPMLVELTRDMLISRLGIVDSEKLTDALQEARHGHEVPIVLLKRVLGIELWLRNLRHFRVVKDFISPEKERSTLPNATEEILSESCANMK
jgi:asparagine synthase (glutamine-hydrolysing)